MSMRDFRSTLLVLNYLVVARRLSSDRIQTLYAERNEVLSEPPIQLWMIPPGEEPHHQALIIKRH